MNVYDSERIVDALAPEGYSETALIEDADLVVLNTCHIREKAAEKVYSELGRVRQVRDARRREGLDLIIAVAGCVAQAEGEEIARRSPAVDIVVGPQSYHRLPSTAQSAAYQQEAAHRNGIPCRRKVREPAPTGSARHGERLFDYSGGLRQVLHVLRGARIRAVLNIPGPQRRFWMRRKGSLIAA